jgi:hypothetical protein
MNSWLGEDAAASPCPRRINRLFTKSSEDEEMLEELSDWLDAPPEILVPATIFLFFILIGMVLALRRPSVRESDDGLEAKARYWINARIEEHIEDLASAYVAIGVPGDEDDLPPGFALTINSFIADSLQRNLDGTDFDLDLRSAIRAFVVLHRAEIYQDVVTHSRKHLAVA